MKTILCGELKEGMEIKSWGNHYKITKVIDKVKSIDIYWDTKVFGLDEPWRNVSQMNISKGQAFASSAEIISRKKLLVKDLL